MTTKNLKFKIVDTVLIALIALPIILCIVLKVLFSPQREGIVISGAMVFLKIPFYIQDLVITEAQVNSLAVIISVFFFCLYMTHGIKAGAALKRHHIAEFVVEKINAMVNSNMGRHFMDFSPFILAILLLSAFSSLLTLFGLYAPTSDINVVAGWAILVFILITYFKLKCGVVHYIKSFADPVLMAPLNIISEVATPISMAFRHYGNVLSGTVISTLVAFGLSSLSAVVFDALPGVLRGFPFLQIGLPAVLSIYFDVFSGCLQAYIFAMLTMLYVSGGYPLELYERRQKLINNKEVV